MSAFGGPSSNFAVSALQVPEPKPEPKKEKEKEEKAEKKEEQKHKHHRSHKKSKKHKRSRSRSVSGQYTKSIVIIWWIILIHSLFICLFVCL